MNLFGNDSEATCNACLLGQHHETAGANHVVEQRLSVYASAAHDRIPERRWCEPNRVLVSTFLTAFGLSHALPLPDLCGSCCNVALGYLTHDGALDFRLLGHFTAIGIKLIKEDALTRL